MLCLPKDPKYLQVQAGLQERGAIYSAQYKPNGFPPLASVQNHEMPCAVCRAKRRGSMLMMPGRMHCPTHWHSEYIGFLMTAHYDHKASKNYVCLDEHAKARNDTLPATHDAALLYPVEGRCGPGNLPCRPYVSGDELPCVVCTM